MAQSNDNADLLSGANGGNNTPGAGTPPAGGNNKPSPGNDDSKKKAANDAVMDIKKYLQKAKMEKSAASLMEVLFKGETFKASEWPGKVEEALNRPVKR
jgi:hypothetical protein